MNSKKIKPSKKMKHYRASCPECNTAIALDHAFNANCSPKHLPLVIDKGKMQYLWDVEGKKYLDFSSLIAVANVGHSNPAVTKAVQDQLKKITHTAGNDFYTPPMTFLAQKLVEKSPGLHKTFFCNTGTESIEAAMKLTRNYQKKPRFIAFQDCFHGRTFGSMSMTSSKAVQREGFAPLLSSVSHVPFPNPYRMDDPTTESLNSLEKQLKTTTPASETAAVFAEPIQGEGGYIVPPSNYFKELKKVLDENNILLVFDEVQSGLGRTGRFWAHEHFKVKPDVICSAKGLGGGLPIGAIVFNKKLDTWKPGSHSNTFGGNALSCAAGLATIDYLEKNKLEENASKQGEYLLKRLNQVKDDYKVVGDVRGKGLMIGVELVKDKHSKEPFPHARDKLMNDCFEDGLIILPAGESTLRLAPPLTINKADCDNALRVLEANLKKLK